MRSLDSLDRLVAASELDPASENRMQSLLEKRQAASTAFGALRSRLRADGRSEVADELTERFASIWRDVDEAMAAPPARRRELLAAVRAALQAARPMGDRRHDLTVTILPTDELP